MTPARLFLCVILATVGGVGCGSTGKGGLSFSSSSASPSRSLLGGFHGRGRRTIRTTAYTHLERDSWEYGVKSARGTNLQYGKVRSAAADWSVYPVGTVFKIEGDPYYYEVDDYGRALVGTETIDLYRPSMSGVAHPAICWLRKRQGGGHDRSSQ
ncbi:MAG: hypothetical protein ACC661_04180 [Verrucomicrobiales bacterium]